MPIEEIYHQLKVYKERLVALRHSPCPDMDKLLFYANSVLDLEAEIAVTELVEEVLAPCKPWNLETDCWETVQMLCQMENVVSIRIKWNWRYFKFMYYIEYFSLR